MEDKATRKAAVDDAMKDVRAQVQSCKDAIKELKEDRKNQIKLVNEKHKESVKFLDTAQDRLNKTLKKLKKFQKDPNVGLDDIVLLQKKKNTSSAIKKPSKLERKNSAKELKEEKKAAKLERKNSAKELKEEKKAAKLERKNSAKDLKESEKAAKLERKNSAKDLKESEKTAKLERKNSEKELKQLIKLERKNSVKEMKEALKREEMEAKKASALLNGKTSIEFAPSKRAALLVSTNDTKKRSAIATMRSFLINKLGFEENSIMTLSNISKDANKMKILERLDELIECANEKDCDEIMFFYSGDGIVVKNVKEEEYEDAIVPCDYKEKGVINSMTFNSRMENISEGVKVTLLFDCCHNENFLESAYEYCGGNDLLNKNNEPRNYAANVRMFSLRDIEPEFKTRGVISNNNSHILARTFIEHYNECVEDNCSDVTVFSMLHDIRDYMVFNEIEFIPVLYSPCEIKNQDILLHIE
ncbi:caspase family protein [bacterium]|nr:caspase family protein [bacterium]